MDGQDLILDIQRMKKVSVQYPNRYCRISLYERLSDFANLVDGLVVALP